MTWTQWDHNGIGYGGSPTGYISGVGNGGLAAHRFIRFEGAPPGAVYPPAGGAVHGCTMDSSNADSCWLATQGMPVAINLGEAVTAGARLETNATGQAVNLGAGVQVARALESGAAGQNIFAVFER